MLTRCQMVRAEPRNILRRVLRTWGVGVALCTPAIAPTISGAEDDTEITVELSSTWQSQSLTNHHHVTATCIVGSNGWFFSGHFLKNARVDYWLVGTNVVKKQPITSSMYFEEAKDFLSEKFLPQNLPSRIAHPYPRAGEIITTVLPSPLGQPAYIGAEGVIWLAFCSADYLRLPDRQIPMPIGPSSRAFGYADKSVLLDEHFGLPKSVQLFAAEGSLACDYEVL